MVTGPAINQPIPPRERDAPVDEDTGRSSHRVDDAALDHLARLATVDEQNLVARQPEGAGRYAGRLIGRALCQGAALHLLDGRNGIKDFDVWSFYAARTDGPYPARRVGRADFGPSPYGTWSGDAGRFTGRRVDLIGRVDRRRPGRGARRCNPTVAHRRIRFSAAAGDEGRRLGRTDAAARDRRLAGPGTRRSLIYTIRPTAKARLRVGPSATPRQAG